MALKVHHLRPAPGAHTKKTRVGRGEGSKGKTAGRGTKGSGARQTVPQNFEGGQMPIHMRMRKLRGPNKKQSMPFEMFRTHTQPVNVGDLDARFEKGDTVDVAAMVAKGLGTRKDIRIKVLNKGEILKPLTVHAHAFSASAVAAIEAAGGSATVVTS